jgi:peptidoglycan/LPS O-acetylase OafA/YrhL
LFHGGVEFFSGGYVGVDVFFVISGYLITQIILAEIDGNKFTIMGFYERRARRILPALLIVIIACLPFAWAWMLPHQLKDFFQSILGVGLFSSNILFWREAGYFAAGVEAKPLLHTWSLAVEEQYYVLFPLLIWLAVKKAGRLGAVLSISVLAAISLVACGWGSVYAPDANYYLLHSRAWELFAGSLAVFARPQQRPGLNNLLSGLGVGLILYAVLTFDANTPFPSLYTVAPVLGTVFIILYGQSGTIVAKILSMKGFVAIGLISYSAYLWHQPLFAFARVRRIAEVDPNVMHVLIVCVFVLAYLSWRFVEQPFRRRPIPLFPGRAYFLTLSAASLLVLIGAGAVGHLMHGFPARLPETVLTALRDDDADRAGCYNALTAEEIREGATCTFGDPRTLPSVAVIGDSHAAQLTDALGALLRENNMAGITINGGWCAPLVGFGTDNPNKNPACRGIISAGYEQIVGNDNIETVLVVGQWANYTLGKRYSDSNPAVYGFEDNGNTTLGGNPGQVALGLRATLSLLAGAGKRVVLLNSVPEYRFEVPDAVAKSLLYGVDLGHLALPMAAYEERNAEVLDILDTVTGELGVSYTDMRRLFCRAGKCFPYDETGFPLYKDNNHVNRTGADVIVDAIAPQIVPQ